MDKEDAYIRQMRIRNFRNSIIDILEKEKWNISPEERCQALIDVITPILFENGVSPEDCHKLNVWFKIMYKDKLNRAVQE